MDAVLAELTLRTLLFPLWMLRPKRAELAMMVLVFSCICCWVWERRVRSSSCAHVVHCMPFFLSAVDCFITQSITSCLTPVCTQKASVGCYVIVIIIVCMTLAILACCDTKLCAWHWHLNSLRFVMSTWVWQHLFFRNTSMMLQAWQDTFIDVWKQSKGRFVEDLHCHQIALMTFLQEA